MNRLTDNDKNYGLFTLAKWKGRFEASLNGGNSEDPENHLLFVAFGRALRIRIPTVMKPFGKYQEYRREFGISLCEMGNGYDFVQVHYGPVTHDSSTEKSWCKHLPWKQWDCVRNSVYSPDGKHFASEKRCGDRNFFEFMKIKETCPTERFDFVDFDGQRIVATCMIEEREWHRGEGWFKWLKWFYPAKIRRSLDIKFNSEVGPDKGSWKGGTTGHGIEMLPSETTRQAFQRYCAKEQEARYGKKFKLKFIGALA